MSSRRRRAAAPVRWSAPRAVGLAVFFAVAVLLQWFFYRFVRSQGVIVGGDEPSYVMQAQALAHLTVHILPTIEHDLAAKVFGTAYPPHTTPGMVEHFSGPNGVVSPFPPGMGVVLAGFVAVLGAVRGAVLGMICLNTAGLMWLHRRTSRLARLSPSGQLVLGLAFAAPAVLLAVNQIFPDLPAGILLGAGLLEIAVIERERRTGITSLVVIGFAASLLPWLQPKNVVGAGLLVAALLIGAGRQRESRIGALVAAGVAVVSLSMFLLYNHHYYGHWLGLPEPSPGFDRSGLQYSLGLLFDRHQGLFVQVPLALVGVAGWLAVGLRRLPVARLATLACALAIVVVNGTYVSNPYGGGSLAGRFMWSLIPLAVPFAAVVLCSARDRRWVIGVLLVAAAALWGLQAEPIFARHHDYYNAMVIPYQPWPTWWPGLGGLLPQFGRNGLSLGSPRWALPAELSAALAVVVVVLYCSRGSVRRTGARATTAEGPRRP